MGYPRLSYGLFVYEWVTDFLCTGDVVLLSMIQPFNKSLLQTTFKSLFDYYLTEII